MLEAVGEDFANLVEQCRAHHDLKARPAGQPRLNDAMRRTSLDRGRHENVRIENDEHGCRGSVSA